MRTPILFFLLLLFSFRPENYCQSLLCSGYSSIFAYLLLMVLGSCSVPEIETKSAALRSIVLPAFMIAPAPDLFLRIGFTIKEKSQEIPKNCKPVELIVGLWEHSQFFKAYPKVASQFHQRGLGHRPLHGLCRGTKDSGREYGNYPCKKLLTASVSCFHNHHKPTGQGQWGKKDRWLSGATLVFLGLGPSFFEKSSSEFSRCGCHWVSYRLFCCMFSSNGHH